MRLGRPRAPAREGSPSRRDGVSREERVSVGRAALRSAAPQAMTVDACDYAFAKISDALCPPKPIELESAVVTARARAVFGT